MTMVLLGKVRYALGGWTGKGKEFTYRKYKENKTLAVCINWDPSSHGLIVYNGAWVSHGYSMKGKSKRNAILHCQQVYEKKYGCACQVIDQNDENVIEVPDEFLARYMGTQPSDRPGRFDGNWGGTMACSTCSNCPGPLQKSVTITIANSEFDFAPDTSYVGVGNIDDQGNVKVRWRVMETYMGATESRNLWFEGKIVGNEIELRGERGPRKCTVTLSRGNP
jgi:hypothetical protein